METKEKHYIYEYDLGCSGDGSNNKGVEGEVLGRFNKRIDTESEELEARVTKRINNEFYPTIGNTDKGDFKSGALTYLLAHVGTTLNILLGIMLILMFKGTETQYLADLGVYTLIAGMTIFVLLSICAIVCIDSVKGIAKSIYNVVFYPIAILTIYIKYQNYKQKVLLEEDRNYWFNTWGTVLNSGDVLINNPTAYGVLNTKVELDDGDITRLYRELKGGKEGVKFTTVYGVLNTEVELENGYITRLYRVLKGDKEGIKFTTKLRVLNSGDKKDKKLMSLNTTKELLTEHDLEYVYNILKSMHDLEKEESKVLNAYTKIKQGEEERVSALKYIQDNRGLNAKKGREVSNLLLEGYNNTRLEEVRENISQTLEESKDILEKLND